MVIGPNEMLDCNDMNMAHLVMERDELRVKVVNLEASINRMKHIIETMSVANRTIQAKLDTALTLLKEKE